MFDRPQLGRILLSHGVVSDEQLEQALAHQQRKGCRLGEALVQMGLCTQLEIARALAEQMELPFVDLEQTPPDPRALRMLPKEIAQEYQVVPVRMEGDRLVVAARNPLDIRMDAAIRRATKSQIVITSACGTQLRSVLARYDEFRWLRQTGTAAPPQKNGVTGLLATAEETQTAQMVDSYLAHAVRRRATEVCFESRPEGLQIRGRIDGHMYPMATVPQQRAGGILTRLKTMSGIVTTADGVSHSGACQIRVDGVSVALESHCLRSVDGELVTLRRRKESVPLLPLAELGLAPEMEERLRSALIARRGLILASGPAGAGAPTTLYALLAELASEQLKIIAVTDEIAYRIPGVHYLMAPDRTGPAFSSTLQIALSQAPDVVLLSEISDRHTAEFAFRAAATGRLVIAGAHSPTALGALARLLDLGIPPHEVAAALTLILAQRLVRRICPDCGKDQKLSFELERLLRGRLGSLDEIRFQRGRGCAACYQMGYRGRTGVFEMLGADEDLRYLLSDRFPPSTIAEHLQKRGFRTLDEDALSKASRGVITPEEIQYLGTELGIAIAKLPGRAAQQEDLTKLEDLDTSAWEINPEAEPNSWDELAGLVNDLS